MNDFVEISAKHRYSLGDAHPPFQPEVFVSAGAGLCTSKPEPENCFYLPILDVPGVPSAQRLLSQRRPATEAGSGGRRAAEVVPVERRLHCCLHCNAQTANPH